MMERSHEDLYHYSCSNCDKWFSVADDSERPKVCPFCAKEIIQPEETRHTVYDYIAHHIRCPKCKGLSATIDINRGTVDVFTITCGHCDHADEVYELNTAMDRWVK